MFLYDVASQIVLSGKHAEALQKQYDNIFDKIEDSMRVYERQPQLLRGNKGTPGNKGREGSSGEKGSKGRKGSTGSKGKRVKKNMVDHILSVLCFNQSKSIEYNI